MTLELFTPSPNLAIEGEGSRVTYFELALAIKTRALELKALGITSFCRVAFQAPAQIASILTFLALLSLEASPCLLSTRLPQEKIPSLLEQGRISFFLDLKTASCQKRSFYSSSAPEILLFTSGSLGIPKLVCLTIEHFQANIKGALAPLGLLGYQNYWLLSVPLFHVSGLSILFRCLATQSCIALTSSQLISHISFVPTQLIRWLRENTYEHFPNLRCLLLGGAPITEALLTQALEKKIPIQTTYGMSETASQITLSLKTDTLLPLHQGKPLPGREISFSKDKEILVRGSCLFSGYDSGEGPLCPKTEEGWFATGDLGRLSQEGNLEYLGRKDNLFISGGENIYPEEIEKTLGSIPGVLYSVVIPISDDEFGQRPLAFVHMASPLPSTEEFQDRLSPFLPRFAFPIAFLPFPPECSLDVKIKRPDLQLWAHSHLSSLLLK